MNRISSGNGHRSRPIKYFQRLKTMEPPIGFEPMTYGLQDRRSTS